MLAAITHFRQAAPLSLDFSQGRLGDGGLTEGVANCLSQKFLRPGCLERFIGVELQANYMPQYCTPPGAVKGKRWQGRIGS